MTGPPPLVWRVACTVHVALAVFVAAAVLWGDRPVPWWAPVLLALLTGRLGYEVAVVLWRYYQRG